VGGGMPYDVEEILVVMQAYQQVTIGQAAELEVKATEKLKALVNAHEKIRPFLREYPFTTERARVRISFTDRSEEHYLGKQVAVVSQAHGQLIYRYYDHEKNQYFDLFKEPYETAKQRVLAKSI
jgi:hypothetical protein